jgi:hypothetical protein
MLPPQVVTTNTVNAILDLIYTMGISSTYSDGSGRTPGSGSAWTWARDTTNAYQTGVTTAVHGIPPVDAIGHKVCFAGSTIVGAPGSKMYLDTYTAGIMMVGTAKNSGSYGTWTSATTPFTTGDFTGFIHACRNTASVTYNTVYMYESQEAIIVQLVTSAGTICEIFAGAYIDPLSSNSLNAESDGRLYGVTSSGSSNVLNAGRWTSLLSQTFNHTAGNGAPHSPIFVPGAGTVQTTFKFMSGVNTTFVSINLTAKNGDIPRITVPMGYLNAAPYFSGQLRQIYMTKNSGSSNLTWSISGVTQGYVLSGSTVTTSEAMVITV